MHEEWFVVPSYSKYEVTKSGRLRNKDSKRELSLHPREDGYVALSLYNNDGKRVSSVRVHILVATTFLPNPENKSTVNHKNKIRNDNKVENLEWATRTEQAVHACAGREYSGSRRQVWQCSLETHERLQLFPSAAAAKRSLAESGITKMGDITNVARKQKSVKGYVCKSAGGFYWEYADEDLIDEPGEEWRTVACVKTSFPYKISSHGRLRGLHGRLHDSYKRQDGYIVCSIDGHTYKLHIIVAQTFLSNPERLPCVNHIDGNKANSRTDNLEWVSFSDNSVHAGLTGLAVHKIRSVQGYGKQLGDLIGTWPSFSSAARATKLLPRNISLACRGREGIRATGDMYWKYADEEATINGVKAYRNGVCCGQWLNVKAAAQVIGCSVSGILSVCGGKRSSIKGMVVERAYIALGSEITADL